MPFITVSSRREIVGDWPEAADALAAVVSECLSAPIGEVQVMIQSPLAAVHGKETYVEVKCRKKPDRPTEKLCDTARRIKDAVAKGLGSGGNDCVVRVFAFDDAVIGSD